MNIEEALASALGSDDAPVLLVLAGCNGAGKTTFFETFLRDTGIAFVNADDIARALSVPGTPVDPYAAAALAGELRRDFVARRRTFCMETVLSDAAGDKLEFLRAAQRAGYRVIFIWIRLASVELSMARVMQRVESGGHDVPDVKLADRFQRTGHNVSVALRFADLALVIDNSSVERPFQHVETWRNGLLVG